MLYRRWTSVTVLTVALCLSSAGARAIDGSKFPEWKGQWAKIGDARWDQSKPRYQQQAPFTPEYQAILEASVADQQAGGPGNDLMYRCIPPGMPRTMIAYYPIEFLFTSEITYIVLEHMRQLRRVYTDGRAWPEQITPSLVGYSIGTWVDEDGDGRYDALLIETRGLKGPRAFDSSGAPLADDNQTIVKERIYRDKNDTELLYDEVTTIDHALTRPWTVVRKYHREAKPLWIEHLCVEDNHQIDIGKEGYFLSGDGKLMPTRKDQPPPDLRYFDQAKP